MTIKRIEEQIAVIQEVGKKARSSKKSAIAFLRSAGIIGVESLNEPLTVGNTSTSSDKKESR